MFFKKWGGYYVATPFLTLKENGKKENPTIHR